jgi:hypothetical protein
MCLKVKQLTGIFKSVQDYNCKSKSKAEMVMRDDVVTQLPRANELRTKVFYKNRTKLVHLHNMALHPFTPKRGIVLLKSKFVNQFG